MYVRSVCSGRPIAFALSARAQAPNRALPHSPATTNAFGGRELLDMSAEQLIEHTLQEGQAAIDGFATHAVRLTEAISATYPAGKTLEAIAKEMAPGVDAAKGATNAKCAAMAYQVRDEAAAAAAAFRAAEMWLAMKAPSISDGNNFGVDVQQYVVGELKAMRTQMEGFVATSKDYHWARAEGCAKLFAGETDKVETSSSETSETKEGKESKEKKTSSTKSKSESKPAGYADYKAYVLDIDVKNYHSSFCALTDIKNSYLKAHMLFAKNLKRLADPRGEGEDGRPVHAMSMF